MSGKITFKQRLNRILYTDEYRVYKYLWEKLCKGELDRLPFCLPQMIKKFGDLE